MADLINVLIVIDSDGILKKYGPNNNPDDPIHITDPNLIFMITEQDNVISGQAGNELCIKGVPGDTVQWREITLSLNPNTDVLLYKYIMTPAVSDKLTSTPKVYETKVSVPLPNSNNPFIPTMQTITEHYWYLILLKTGNVTYQFNFMILDAAGQVKGYYRLDLLIQITKNELAY